MTDTKPALRDLIERLEHAEGPNRELDAALAPFGGLVKNGPDCWSPHSGGITQDVALELPYYTASLDAALTLVPEGLAWRVEPATPGYTDWGKYRAGVTTWEKPYDLPSYGATPAIALCIAALKARE